jgi:hypothetical protein
MSLFFRKSLQKNAEKMVEELELKNRELRDDYSEIGTCFLKFSIRRACRQT